MERLVLDTNSLIQILPRKSRYNSIWQKIRCGICCICVTTEILEEYEEILGRFYGVAIAKATIEFILNNPGTLLVTPYYHFGLIKADEDDNKFVDCAITANARFIVTEDKHFDILKQISFPHVDIIGLDEYLATCNIDM